MAATPKAVIAVIAGLGLAAALARHLTSPRSSRPGGEPARAAGAGPDLAARPGRQHRWKLDLQAHIESSRGQPLTTRVTGTWIGTISETSAEGYVVAYQLAEPGVSGSGAGAEVGPAQLTEWRRQASTPFFVSYRRDGAALRVHFPPSLDAGVRNLLEMVVTQTQLVRPAGAALHWTALERDAAGTYLAAYDAATSPRVRKRKLEYTAPDPSAGPAVDLRIGKADLQFQVDAANQVVGCDGEEALTIDLHLPGARLEASTSIHLREGITADAPSLVGSFARELGQLDSQTLGNQHSTAEEARRRSDRLLLEGQDPERLLAAGGWNRDDHPQLAARLAALFRTRPAAVERAGALLREGAGAGGLAEALGAAGTAAAQAALVGVARDPTLPDGARATALTALIQVEQPDAATVTAVHALLAAGTPKTRQAAIFVGGALARAARRTHSAEAAALERALILGLDRATDRATRLDLLSGLGNSASPEVVPAIERALQDRDPLVRAAAARGLRLAQTPGVERLLDRILRDDQDPAVRAAALLAVELRDVRPHVPAVIQAAREDRASVVRARAVRLLSRYDSEEVPAIREALSAAAERDPNAQVRRLARDALGRRPVALR